MPFSDPLADGPVIQRATERALAAGGSLRATLDADRDRARRHRGADRDLQLRESAAPHGARPRSRSAAAAAGVDGVLALDLPIEEAGEFRDVLASAGLDTIFLLSPTTTDARIRRAAELGSGFLYGISRLGVTGARDRVATGAEAMVRRIRAHTDLPIALGFGISQAGARRGGRRLRRRRGRRQRAGVADRRGERVAAAHRTRRGLRARR